MHFYLIGIDYNSAPIGVRDEIYRKRKAVSDFWRGHSPYGASILITCNRLEIYGVSEYADDAFGLIHSFAEGFPDFAEHAYIKHSRREIFRHALRLSTGLESQIIGEGEILAQLEKWARDIPVPPLKDLLSEVISLSRKIRAASKLDEDNDNIATLILNDIKRRLRPKEKYEVIVIGTGKIAELFAGHGSMEAHINFAAHKNYDKAKSLAKHSKGVALYLKDLPSRIARADVIICATSSPHYVIRGDHFSEWPIERKYPLYIYDLAIPRGVDPQVASLGSLSLQNLEDLDHIFYRYNESRRQRAELASDLIEDTLNVSKEVTHGKDYQGRHTAEPSSF